MYSPLCIIEILHSYFTDARCQGVLVLPTTECAALLRGHRMLVKQVGNRAYVLMDTDASGVPLVDIGPEVVLRFQLAADAPDLFQYTKLPYSPATSSRFYFGNLAANQQGGKQYLTVRNAAFNAANSYAPGNLATSGGNLYECIQSLAANPVNAIPDATHWASRGAISAPSPADLLPWGTGDETINLPAPVPDATVTIYALDPANNQFDTVVSTMNLTFPTPQSSIQAPLGGLPGGKYRVTGGGAEQYFYHDPEAPAQAVIGAVEFFNHLDGGNAYSLLDASGKPKGTTFTVNLLNPLVIWKYIARTAGVQAVRDTSGVYSFDGSVPLQFRSTMPIPVTQAPYGEIALDYKSATVALTTYSKIMNPSLANLKQITVGTDQVLCAEVYLNY